jgi:hypothetical protein
MRHRRELGVVSYAMDGETTQWVHQTDVESDVTEGRLVVRCSCGWEQSASGWMLESSQEEIRRLVAEHLAEVSGPTRL